MYKAEVRQKELWYRGTPGTLPSFVKQERILFKTIAAARDSVECDLQQLKDIHRVYRDGSLSLVAVYTHDGRQIPLEDACSKKQLEY